MLIHTRRLEYYNSLLTELIEISYNKIRFNSDCCSKDFDKASRIFCYVFRQNVK